MGADLHFGEGDPLRLEERERLLVNPGEVPEFDKVNAPLSGFSLGDEGLRPRHEPRDFRLRQASRLTGLFEAIQKEPIFPNVVLGLQWLPRWLRGSFYSDRNRYPKIEYCDSVGVGVESQLHSFLPPGAPHASTERRSIRSSLVSAHQH